ncbi:MAG: hypothetical protein ACREP2_08285 [Rhodanobacteraceae bacterium]
MRYHLPHVALTKIRPSPRASSSASYGYRATNLPRRVFGVCVVALSAALLCACPQLGGQSAGNTPTATTSTTATPAAAVSAGQVTLSSLANVPGRTLAASEGFNCRFFLWDGNGNYLAKFQGAMHGLQADAARDDANAVVNVRVSATPFAQQGSEWKSSIVNLCGDEVKLN